MGSRINTVIDSLERSGVRKFADQASLSSPGQRYIRLGLGQSEEPVHQAVLRAAAEAGAAGHTQYTPNLGIQELRQRLAVKLQHVNRIDVEADQIIVTVGATFGLALSIGSILDPGDEFLVPDPGYPNYAPLVRHYGGMAVFYPLRRSANFCPDVGEIRRLITPRTKGILLNSPGNPTGVAYPPQILEEIVELAAARGIWVVSDEVYDELCYDGSYVCAARSDYRRVVSVFSFSKTYNIPGLRVGYVVNRDQAFIEKMVNMQELYISCAPSISQYAAIAALEIATEYVPRIHAVYREKMALGVRILGDLLGYTPNAAFYLFLDVGKTGMSADRVAERCFTEHRIIVAPGSTFGPSCSRSIRVALVPGNEEIAAGLNTLKSLLKAWQEKSASP